MNIQINTDNNVVGNEKLEATLNSIISNKLERYSDQITRIEIHLSDQDGPKNGVQDMRCLLEARLEGLQPIAVTNSANNAELAARGALNKLDNLLKTKLGRLRDH